MPAMSFLSLIRKMCWPTSIFGAIPFFPVTISFNHQVAEPLTREQYLTIRALENDIQPREGVERVIFNHERAERTMVVIIFHSGLATSNNTFGILTFE